MVMASAANKKQYILSLVLLLLAAVGMFGVLPQLSNFDSSLEALSHAKANLVILAIAAGLLSCGFSALLYMIVSFQRLTFTNTLLVQLSGLFINRILPGGVGGLGLNFLYLRHQKHSASQATTVVALNNTIGFIGHFLLAVACLIIYVITGNELRFNAPTVSPAIGLIIGCIAIGLVVLWKLQQVQLRKLRTVFGKQFRVLVTNYAEHPLRMVAAIALSCCLTLSNVACLWLSCQAVGVSISFIAVFVVFTFGIAVSTATPTPGGLGGAEAALAAGLMSQHISSPLALAAALLYRLVSFWFGLVIGLIAFTVVQSRHLLKTS